MERLMQAYVEFEVFQNATFRTLWTKELDDCVSVRDPRDQRKYLERAASGRKICFSLLP